MKEDSSECLFTISVMVLSVPKISHHKYIQVCTICPAWDVFLESRTQMSCRAVVGTKLYSFQLVERELSGFNQVLVYCARKKGQRRLYRKKTDLLRQM